MGMYTEFVFAVQLREEVPLEVEKVLRHMVFYPSKEVSFQLPNHPFFKCSRWEILFVGNSYMFDGDTHSSFRFDWISRAYHLTVRSSLKNYDNEIDNFLDWIVPYVYTTGFVGYEHYEEYPEPHLHFFESGKILDLKSFREQL